MEGGFVPGAALFGSKLRIRSRSLISFLLNWNTRSIFENISFISFSVTPASFFASSIGFLYIYSPWRHTIPISICVPILLIRKSCGIVYNKETRSFHLHNRRLFGRRKMKENDYEGLHRKRRNKCK